MKYYGVPVSLNILRLWSFSANSFQRSFRRSGIRDPYDILRLQKTCSIKDVKKAYIKLCKEFHPDMKPGDASQHRKFIELNKAYTELLNSYNKKQNIYNCSDFSHMTSRHQTNSTQNSEFEEPWYKREDYQEYYHRSYKTENNLKRTKANILVLSGCFVLVVLGSVLYYSAYSYATKYTTQNVDERSKQISENYYDSRKNALDKGKMEQLDNFKKRWCN